MNSDLTEERTIQNVTAGQRNRSATPISDMKEQIIRMICAGSAALLTDEDVIVLNTLYRNVDHYYIDVGMQVYADDILLVLINIYIQPARIYRGRDSHKIINIIFLFITEEGQWRTVTVIHEVLDVLYYFIRRNPVHPDEQLSIVGMDFDGFLQSQGIEQIGEGINMITSIPAVVEKCNHDVKVLGEALVRMTTQVSADIERIKSSIETIKGKDVNCTLFDVIVSRLEDLVMLAVGLTSATNTQTVIILVVQYFKTFLKGSAVCRIVDLMTSLCSSIRALFSNDDSELKEQSIDCEAPISWLRYLNKTWSKISNSDLIANISNIITILGTFIFSEDPEFVTKSNFFGLFKAKVWDNTKSSKNLIELFLNTVTFFVERGVQVLKTGNIGMIWYSDDEWYNIEKEYEKILSWSRIATTSYFDDIADRSERIFSGPEDYTNRLSELRDKLEQYLKVEKNERNRALISNMLFKLANVHVTLRTKRKTVSYKEAPFCILIYGDTAIGKSLLMNATASAVAGANDFPLGQKHVVSINESDKYDSEYDMNVHHTVFIDDIMNTRAEWYQNPPTDRLLRIKNNQPQTVIKPDVESKGQMIWNAKLLIMSTNVKDLKAGCFSNVAVSLLRRVDMYVTARLKKDYKDECGLFVNRTNRSIPDAWEFCVEKLIVTGPDSFHFTQIALFDKTSDYLAFVAKNSVEYFIKQRNMVRDVEDIFSTGLCKHFFAARDCEICEAGKIVKLSRDTMGQEDDNVSISTEYLNREARKVTFKEERQKKRMQKQALDDPTCVSAPAKISNEKESVRDEDFISLITEKTPKTVRAADDRSYLSYVSDMEAEDMREVPCAVNLFPNYYGKSVHIGKFIDTGHGRIVAADWSIGSSIFRYLETGDMWNSFSLKTKLETFWDVARNAVGAYVIVERTWATICWALKTVFGKFVSQAIEVREPTKIEGEKTNPWTARKMMRSELVLKPTKESASTTPQDLSRRVGIALACCKLTFAERRIVCNALPLKGRYWLFPAHSIMRAFEFGDSFELTITNTSQGYIGFEVSELVSISNVQYIDNKDLAVVKLISACPQRGFMRYFLEQDINTSESFFGEMIYRPRKDWFNVDNRAREASIQLMETSLDHNKVYRTIVKMEPRRIHSVGDLSYSGFKYTAPFDTFSGLCGAVCVVQARGAAICGVHLAGEGTIGVFASLLLSDIENALVKFESVDICDTGFNREAYGYSYDQPGLRKEGEISSDISPKHSMLYMDAAKPVAAIVYGPHVKGTRTLRSAVRKSPISDAVERVIGLKNIHGPPKNLTNWRPFQEAAQFMMEPPYKFEPRFLESAVRSLTSHHIAAIDNHDLVDHVHFVSMDVAVHGREGMTGLDRIDLSTSAGHPLDKSKKTLLDLDKCEIDAYGVIKKIVFVPQVEQNVNTMLEEAKNGERFSVFFRANLKDEPTKFEKETVRLFAGCPIDFLIVCKMALSGLNRVMQLHWDHFECCVGVDNYSTDWTRLYNSFFQKGCENRFFCGDYKHWDKTMAPTLLDAASRVILNMCKHCGYSHDELLVVQAIMTELIYPRYEWDGMYIQFLSSMPSGVFITVMMSNIANSLLFRYTFAKSCDDAYPFDEFIKCNFMGDDNVGTVAEGCDWWNQQVHAHILAEVGIEYTSADKKSALTEFVTQKDVSYLKRGFVWNEELRNYLSPIEESSICKSLHNYMKRKGSSVEPLAISAAAIENALNEYFRIGEDIYNQRREQFAEIVRMFKMAHYCPRFNDNAFPTYRDMMEDYKERYISKSDNCTTSDIVASMEGAPFIFCAGTKASESKMNNQVIEEITNIDVTMTHDERDANPPIKFQKQALEDKLGLAIGTTTGNSSQVVTFKDSVSQIVYDVKSEHDTTFTTQDSPADSLGDFLSRPVKIFSGTISVNTGYFNNFDPWSLFFSNVRVINRISNYNLIRGKLVVKFVLNGNPFYYGRFLVSYLPMEFWDEMEKTVGRTVDECTLCTQRPHIFLDPSTNQGGTMVLPFFSFTNNFSIPNSSWTQNGGRIFIDNLVSLQHANNGTDSITICAFAHMIDVQMSIPTTAEPAGLVPQAQDESDVATGKISAPASAIAKVAYAVGKVPVLKPYATAAGMIADTVAAVAKVFGYSRPLTTCVPASRHKPEYLGNMANTDVGENCTILALDSKNAVTIDPRVVGLSDVDEMAISHIVAHESFIFTFPWSPAQLPESCLAQVRVDPCLYRQLSTAKYLSSTAFASLPFKYWSGTLKFRFQIVCSAFHKGRMRIVYDPVSIGSTSQEYNVNYTHIVDISETKDVCVEIPVCSTRPLLRSFTVNAPTTDLYSTGSTLVASTSQGNGIISVYVVSELSQPADAGASIQVIVSIAGGDDFSVYDPIDTTLKTLVLQPQSMDEPDVDAVLPFTSDCTRMIDIPDKHELYPLIYTGESIKSFRNLIKRYSFHTSWGPIPSNIGYFVMRVRSSMFPFNRGNVLGAINSRAGAIPYTFCNTTLLNYVSWAYVGWRGSIRWKIVHGDQVYQTTDSTANVVVNNTKMIVVRESDISASTYEIATSTTLRNTNNNTNAHRMLTTMPTCMNGAVSTITSQNPVAEIAIPYSCNKRFQMCRLQDRTSGAQANIHDISAKTTYLFYRGADNGWHQSVDEYVAAGDDFSLYFYVGPPILYIESSFPSPN